MRARVHALDPAIELRSAEALGEDRHRLVFDLGRAGVARAELVRLLAEFADLESVGEATPDIEQALNAALAAQARGAAA